MSDAVILSLAEEAPDAHRRGTITLEHVIRIQMLSCGFNPNNKEDIFEFWQTLGVSCSNLKGDER